MKNAVKQRHQETDEIHIEPESTFLNPGIRTLKQLKDWIYTKLGYPLISVELTDEQLNCCIADALSLYTKYCYIQDRYLQVNLRFYEPGEGIDLSEFNIMSVKDIALQRDNIFGMNNDTFFGMYACMGQGIGGPMFGMGRGDYVGSWVTYHNLHEFFDLSKRMTGNNPNFQYHRETKRLVLFPEPRGHYKDQCILLTCNVERPIEEYYGNEYFRRLCLAEAKIMLGTIRKKFSNVQLVGGGSIDTSIGDEGITEKQAALDDLIRSESKGQFFVVM